VKSTLSLFSSSRRHGNTGRLMDRVAGELGIQIADLTEKSIAPYTYEHSNRKDDFEPLMSYALRFEQLIFASPVYWYSMTPHMKAFLDRISDFLDLPELQERGRRLRGKSGFVLCTSIMDAPDPGFIDAFQQTFDYLGMRYGGYVHANCTDGYIAERYEGDVQTFLNLVRCAP
jgi:multimeric flavodoxin WrbA